MPKYFKYNELKNQYKSIYNAMYYVYYRCVGTSYCLPSKKVFHFLLIISLKTSSGGLNQSVRYW